MRVKNNSEKKIGINFFEMINILRKKKLNIGFVKAHYLESLGIINCYLGIMILEYGKE